MASEPIDLTSEPESGATRDPAEVRRPFLGIHFACCGVYSRVYKNASGLAFAGNCPRCGKPIEIGISPDGESGRFFSAY